MTTRMYVGGYTPSSGETGHGAGITVFDRPDGGAWGPSQVVYADDPTFLTLTEGALHAASETPEGRVISYTVSAGALVPASVAPSGGSAPCHLILDPASGALIVANYGGGTIGVLSADASDPARVTRVLALPGGHGPRADRQDGAHAHNIVPTPWGTLVVSDLGTDRLVEFRVDPVTLDPVIIGITRMPSGSGPRHFAWLGSQLLVTGELDGRVHVLSRVDEKMTVEYSVGAIDVSAPFDGDVLLSHIEVVGSIVYVAVRGRDTITVLAPGGEGRLGVVAEVSSGGRWPRHFAVDGDSLYVANQLGDSLAVLPLDPSTGVPGAPVLHIALGSPSCIVFA